MFADTDLHLCILTPDPFAEVTNHTVYHSVSCMHVANYNYVNSSKFSVFHGHISFDWLNHSMWSTVHAYYMWPWPGRSKVFAGQLHMRIVILKDMRVANHSCCPVAWNLNQYCFIFYTIQMPICYVGCLVIANTWTYISPYTSGILLSWKTKNQFVFFHINLWTHVTFTILGF